MNRTDTMLKAAVSAAPVVLRLMSAGSLIGVTVPIALEAAIKIREALQRDASLNIEVEIKELEDGAREAAEETLRLISSFKGR